MLRRSGYRTVYATDEVRFANIDETYGFDQVVTPPIGASDFLIGTYNELPLASVVVNTRVGSGSSHSRTRIAASRRYSAGDVPPRLHREVSFDDPTLFITHLTAAHWPYYTSDTTFGVPESLSEKITHLPSWLTTADACSAPSLKCSRRRARLKNATGHVLSDHGEALGIPGDPARLAMGPRIDGLQFPLMVNHLGHGQSVLSPVQYQVLLGFRSFGSSETIGVSGREFRYPVTVEDISPNWASSGIGGDPLSATGQSLLPMLESGRDATVVEHDRIRFTETDPKLCRGRMAESTKRPRPAELCILRGRQGDRAIADAARVCPLALAYKERAAFTRDQLLAAMPAGPYAHQYIFLDFPQNRGRLLMAGPGGR